MKRGACVQPGNPKGASPNTVRLILLCQTDRPLLGGSCSDDCRLAFEYFREVELRQGATLTPMGDTGFPSALLKET